MSAESQNQSEPDMLTEEEVRDYLKAHSDFFDRHPDMLDHLHIAHSSGSAVSLVEKQVSVLRERNVDMRKRLTTLTGNARDNDRLYELTRSLVLALLDATNLDELGAAFERSMIEDFGVEHSSLIMFGDPAHTDTNCRVDSLEAARIEIGALLRSRNSICGALRKEELSYLFPDAGDVGSAAVMPLANGGELGVIAVGSSDAHHYTSGMGTLFLSHIADVMVRLIPRLDGPGHSEEQ